MRFSKHLIVFLSSFWIECCLCKFYTSSFEISKLLKTERKLLDSLNGFFERQHKNGQTFDSSVKEFVNYAEKQNNDSTENPKTTENPIAVFYLLFRAVKKWDELTKNLSCNEEHEECPILTGADVINVVKRREGSEWPTEIDLKQAATNIVNIWNVYDLDLEHLISGTLDQLTERPLSADDIFFIANAARDAGMTYEAITWFEFLLLKLDTFQSYTFKTSTLYRRLALTYREFEMLSKAIELLQNYSTIDPDDKGVSRDLTYLKTITAAEKEAELARFQANDTSKITRSRQQFEEFCRSSAQGETQFSCSLQCSQVPLYNYYGRVKVEMLSKRPRIEILYDVLSFNETDKIISYGDKSFGQFYEMFPGISVTDHRLKSGPMCEWSAQYPLMNNLTRRLEQMTRFHMYPAGYISSSECYTMTNEGPGFISKPMVDHWPQGHQPYPLAGNRVATIMLQLSDVKYGGSVVFPRLNVTVPVNKGSAVVWWNLKQNGTPSTRSVHMGCPVMVGSSWALFKNILYSNQMFRRPCEAQ